MFFQAHLAAGSTPDAPGDAATLFALIRELRDARRERREAARLAADTVAASPAHCA